MKHLTILAVLMLVATAVAQNPAPFTEISMQRMTFSGVGVAPTSDCLLINANGSFHREHEVMGEVIWTDVYEGTLSEADMKALIAAIDNDEFKAIKLPEVTLNAMRRMKEESLIINILRPGGGQSLNFPSPETRKAHENTLKPLLSWWKSLEKRKMKKIKGAEPTGCMPGTVRKNLGSDAQKPQ